MAQLSGRRALQECKGHGEARSGAALLSGRLSAPSVLHQPEISD